MTFLVSIRAFDFAGGLFAIAAEDGQRVHGCSLLDRATCIANAYRANMIAFDDAQQAEIGDEVAPCPGHAHSLRCRTELKEGAHHA
jgi:hypothetical protein